MRELVDVHYPQAQQIRVVMDNLSTHSPGALYEALPAAEAHRVLRRLEFHYTPKHASWLNMVEVEIGVMRGQCLDRRIGEREGLVSQIAAWEQQRNALGARVQGMFTTERARTKPARAYRDPIKELGWRRGGVRSRRPCASPRSGSAPRCSAPAPTDAKERQRPDRSQRVWISVRGSGFDYRANCHEPAASPTTAARASNSQCIHSLQTEKCRNLRRLRRWTPGSIPAASTVTY